MANLNIQKVNYAGTLFDVRNINNVAVDILQRVALTPTNVTALNDNGTPSLDFNGTDSTLVTNLTDNSGLTNGFTISAWIKPDGRGEGSDGGRIADKSTDTAGQDGFRYCMDSSNRLRFTTNDGTSRFTDSNAVPYGVWTHVLVTVASNATVTHYVNGVQNGVSGTSGSLSGITTANALTIGNRSTATDRTFDGGIALVKVISGVVTEAQRTQLYQEGKALVNIESSSLSAGLIARYPLSLVTARYGGTDLLAGWNFTSGWNAYIGGSVIDATSFQGDADGGGISKSNIVTIGKRYKMRIAGTVTGAGTFSVAGPSNYFNAKSGAGSFDVTRNFTAATTANLYLYLGGNTQSVVITALELYEIVTLEDTSGNVYHGTLTTGNSNFTTDRMGVANMSYDFDGADTKITTTLTSNTDFLNGFTISAWIKPDNIGETAGYIFSKEDSVASAGFGNGFGLKMAVNNAVATRIATGSVITTPDNSIPFNTWSHVVVTYLYVNDTTTTLTIYVNGVNVASGGSGSGDLINITTDNPFLIGNNSTSARTFDGSISDVRIWNRVLTAAEIGFVYGQYNNLLKITP